MERMRSGLEGGFGMRIGVYQFASSGDVERNLTKILAAMKEAALQKVRLLVFHECALCGYPPVETTIDKIDGSRKELEKALCRISESAARNGIYTTVGTVRYEGEKRYNSMTLFDDKGREQGHYDKSALWGWDLDHFAREEEEGIFVVDGLRIGLRICFDVRFPECFRKLYRKQVSLCFVGFSDTARAESPERLAIIRSHLITRAVENVMTVVSVNSTGNYQTAPTAVFNQNGKVVQEARPGQEELMIYDYSTPPMDFGMEGRAVNNEYFLGPRTR